MTAMPTEGRQHLEALLKQSRELRNQILSRPADQRTPRLSILIKDIARMEAELTS